MDVNQTKIYNCKDPRNGEDEEEEEENSSSSSSNMEPRRGPWTIDEDLKLINYITIHGEGKWNSLSRAAGLKRTGKSCRLRWLNYLRPDVRRGNITLEEQLTILELHSLWGNRWSKIAQYLPGRTDNEIKNYWRTRVQKHAKQLKCDVNSKQFQDTVKYLWMPRLVERIQATAAASTATTGAEMLPASLRGNVNFALSYTPENSSCGGATSSPESLGTNGEAKPENCYEDMMMSASPATASFFNDNQYGYRPPLDQPQSSWFDGGDASTDGLWTVDDFNWFLQQQQLNINGNNYFM